MKEVQFAMISEFQDEFFHSNENANNLLNDIEDLKTKIDIMLKAYERGNISG